MKLYFPFLRMSLGLAVLSTAFLLGCEPEDLGAQLTPDEGLRTVTVGVSAEGAGTKAEISDELVFSWTAGDKIAVWAGSEGSGQYYESDAYAGGNTYQISLSGTRSNYAVYPAIIGVAEAATAGSLKVKLPAEYDFTAVGADYSPLPMIAINNEGQDLAFMHLGGLLRITLGDLPAGTSYVTVDLGKPINGIFPVHLESDGSYISNTDEITGGSNVTKFLVPSPVPDNMVLNLPVPTGSYESVTVTAYDGDNNVLGSDSPTFSWNCARARGKKLTDDDFGWVYVFGTLTDGTVPYSGGDVTLASGFQSYRYRGETQEKVPYVVEYSLDGETWSTEAPDWLPEAPTTSAGSVGGEVLTLEMEPQYNAGDDPHRANLLIPVDKDNLDLSTVNPATGASGIATTTANCYVVQAPGTYRFPLVYGNALNLGETNDAAYHRQQETVTDERFPEYLFDHTDAPIQQPYIALQPSVSGKTLTARLLWTDAIGLVKDVSVSGTGQNAYLSFSVPRDRICQGNALVALLADNVIVWSWHIWVTDDDLTVTQRADGDFLFAPVNIGWCDGKTEVYPGRSCQVRAVQDGSGLVSETATIVQEEKTIETLGNSTLFQWGRKDPLQASNGKGNDKVYYPSDVLLVVDNLKVAVGTTIQQPCTLYCPQQYEATWMATDYYNLWNTSTDDREIDDTNLSNPMMVSKKTIYDPNPVGFQVPLAVVWKAINKNSFLPTAATETCPGGRTHSNGLFLPGVGQRGISGIAPEEPLDYYFARYWSSSNRDGTVATSIGINTNTSFDLFLSFAWYFDGIYVANAIRGVRDSTL